MQNPIAWETLEKVAAEDLVDTRLQLHWASQVVASIGNAVLEHKADDSQSNLGWHLKLGVLAGHPTSQGLRGAMDLRKPSLLMIDGNDVSIDEFELDGKTLREAFRWAESALQSAGVQADAGLTLRDYEMPHHPVSDDSPFSLQNADALETLARLYANSDAAIRATVSARDDASPVRCWPHHFDIASLVTLDQNRPAEEARSIGIGMSPGDDSYAEPYFYVNPWPRPENAEPGNLPLGAWHTEGWFGAVLTYTQLIEGSTPNSQAQCLAAFQSAAMAAAHKLL